MKKGLEEQEEEEEKGKKRFLHSVEKKKRSVAL